jgi:hypothetical protein
MMGERQINRAALFYEFSLDRHVPADHALRAIDRFVDECVGREVAAPPWSAACITDQGPSQRDEPMWVYVARDGHAGKKNALRLEIYAPHSNGGNKTHDDWPANMILG